MITEQLFTIGDRDLFFSLVGDSGMGQFDAHGSRVDAFKQPGTKSAMNVDAAPDSSLDELLEILR